MKIITVKGKDGSWKTSLISKVYDYLYNKDSVYFFKKEGNNNHDFKALAKYNHKIIAFCSIGDPADSKHLPSEYILRGLIFASKNEADILINAYSDSFGVDNGGSEFSYKTYRAIIKGNDYIHIPMYKNRDLRKQLDKNYKKILNEL